jgi:hypothetical protein
VRLALIFEKGSITVGPRDAATIEWLEKRSGQIHCSAALGELSKRWMARGISRRDLPIIAAELQSLIHHRYRAHAEGHHWYHPALVVEVRACEYVAPPPTHLELQEIR